QKQSLNGQWKIIIDPYETGYYNYRYQPRTDRYFENRKQKDKSELVEYNFDNSEELTVPGRQDMYNRKGLLSDKGEKKQAFYVLQNFYREKIK
ncbi:MAG: hypothetical protein WC557_07605, partial [Ignavibacteriaceae bacterium]